MTRNTGQRLSILGVRHHDVASAHAVETALPRLDPAIVLIEGPPEANAILPLAASAEMRPPIALSAMARGDPTSLRHWPFAAFSPEWVGLRWALAAARPVRFIDWPLANRLAAPALEAAAAIHRAGLADADQPRFEGGDPFAFFDAVLAAHAALGDAPSDLDARREARMRIEIRSALRQSAEKPVAVICGARHGPALAACWRLGGAARDRALLQGAPRRRVDIGWCAWRLSDLSPTAGYAPGPAAPGWAQQQWETRNQPSQAPARLFAAIAGTARARGAPASTANALAAATLARELAHLRGHPACDASDVADAGLSAMAAGDPKLWEPIADRFLLGRATGAVPEAAPASLLAQDVAAEARRLRLRLDGGSRVIDIDRRTPLGRDRSVFLRRLQLLSVLDEAALVALRPTRRGGFQECWRLDWSVAADAAVREASRLGAALAIAAERWVEDAVTSATDVAALTQLAERAALAELPEPCDAALRRLVDSAAAATAFDSLAEALTAVQRVSRYGDVDPTRRARLEALGPVLLDRLAAICMAGAAMAEGALPLLRAIDNAAEGLDPNTAAAARWREAMRRLATDRSIPARLRGWATGRRALQDNDPAPLCAALQEAAGLDVLADWLTGALDQAGGGPSQPVIRGVDAWLAQLPEAAFLAATPALRAAFAGLPGSARRAAWRMVAAPCAGAATGRDDASSWRPDIIAAAAPVLAALLGRDDGGGAAP